MPLHILAPMVVVGLALVIGTAWWMDRGKRRALLDEEGFRNRFLTDFPNEKIIEILPARDRTSAVLRLAAPGRLGLVFQMGQNQSTRLLEPEMIAAIRHGRSGLELELNDFSAHVVHLEFNDSDRLARLQAWFGDLENSKLENN